MKYIMKYIGIDIDDTVSDSNRAVLSLMKKRYGIEMAPEDRTTFMLHDSPKLRNRLGPYEGEQLFADVWKEHKSMRLIDLNIPKYVRSLRRRFGGITMITSSPGSSLDIKAFLRGNEIEFDRFEHVGLADKYLLPVVACLDDCDYVALTCSMVKPTVLFSQPWNRNFRDLLIQQRDTSIKIADNWAVVEERLVDAIEGRPARRPILELLRERQNSKSHQT